MRQTALAWAAFKNMLKAAGRDPLWAFIVLIFAPFNAAKPVLQILATISILMGIVFVAGTLALDEFGFGQGSLPRQVFHILLMLLLLALAFRLLTTPLILHFGDDADGSHGSARFATKREMAPLTQAKSGLLIGRDPKSSRLLRYDGQAHLITIAPTRSGKGVGTIIPNLLTADRSIVCIDPKGENAATTALARQRYGPVLVIDPFGITGLATAALNPLDDIDPSGVDAAEDVSTLADALVLDDPGMSGEAHWNEEAKALIAGLLLMIVAVDPPARRHLVTLREYLTLAPERFAALLERMQDSGEVNPLIARAANRHLGKSDREAAGVLSSAQRHTHFLDSPRMAAVLGRSDFRFADLKRHHATVFLVLPPDRLSTYSRWLRLLLTQSLTEMARAPAKPDVPVLYLLDEFASLGHLASVERAMGLMAGYGIQLWPILQDIHQLRSTYGGRSGTFLSNAGVLQVFGVNDYETARLISELLGQETVVLQAMGRALDSEKSGISFSEQHSGRPLLTPDEVRTLPRQSQLLFLAGRRPILARKLEYYADPEFQALLD